MAFTFEVISMPARTPRTTLPTARVAATDPTYRAPVAPAGSSVTVCDSESSTPPSMWSRPAAADSAYFASPTSRAKLVSRAVRSDHHEVQLAVPDPGDSSRV